MVQYWTAPQRWVLIILKGLMSIIWKATETNDDLKATAVKLVSNSMYGQMLQVYLIKNYNFFNNKLRIQGNSLQQR